MSLPAQDVPEWMLWLAFLIRSLSLHLAMWILPICGLCIWAGGTRTALAGLCLAAWLGIPPALAALPQRGEVQGPRLRIASYNSWGARNARPRQAAAALANLDADLICIQELQPAFAALLEPMLADSHPHRITNYAKDRFYGSAIYSRLPLQGEAPPLDLDGAEASHIRARLLFAGTELLICNLHLPRHSSTSRRHLQGLHSLIDTTPGPLVMIGDFNFTQYSRAHQGLEERGLRDALDTAGSGLKTTWPVGRTGSWLLYPGFRIDHCYLNGAIEAWHAQVLDIGGSDHRMLLVEIHDSGG